MGYHSSQSLVIHCGYTWPQSAWMGILGVRRSRGFDVVKTQHQELLMGVRSTVSEQGLLVSIHDPGNILRTGVVRLSLQ